MPLLKLEGLAKSFGPVAAVSPLDLTVEAGDFCAILGPSGCGKSTLLRMIAGFLAPSAGRILIDGVDVSALGPEKRPTNMVFQGYGLFPHLTVAENIGFGLRLQKRPREETATRTEEALRLVRLEGFGGRGIDKLSGGQQQRVALARALIMRPKILLLDEPLAALDLKLRHQMQEELRRIHADIGGTFIFVTHDQGEAFALANRVAVMNAGRLEQIGSPREVYREPASLFVANFVGETAALKGYRTSGIVTLDAGSSFASTGPDGPVTALLRPEHVRASAGGVPAMVTARRFMGNAVRIDVQLCSGESVGLNLSDSPSNDRYQPGARLSLSWDADDLRVISGDTP